MSAYKAHPRGSRGTRLLLMAARAESQTIRRPACMKNVREDLAVGRGKQPSPARKSPLPQGRIVPLAAKRGEQKRGRVLRPDGRGHYSHAHVVATAGLRSFVEPGVAEPRPRWRPAAARQLHAYCNAFRPPVHPSHIHGYLAGTVSREERRYRFRLLVKSLRNVDLSEYLREWLAAGPKTKGNLKLEVDVDPQSFL